ncbi:MAG: hypothetical protein Q8J88_02610 [Bacteroidales bacterium]|nr:hypothetical protein [Bacteroidales bacterium]
MIALLLASSCTNDKSVLKASAFNTYLISTCNTTAAPNALYIIMPSYACRGCITEIFHLLKPRAATPNIIIVGVAGTKSGLAGFFTGLETYNICHDTQNAFIKNFMIEMDKPYYILIEKGRIAQQGSVSPEKLEILEAIIFKI